MRTSGLLLFVVFSVLSFLGGFYFSGWILGYAGFNYQSVVATLVLLASVALSLQGVFTLIWMLYAWENPEDVSKHKSPKEYVEPALSFTALLPANDEEHVIGDTINSINAINYADTFKEILIICPEGDIKTIEKVKQTLARLSNKNIRLLTFNRTQMNKPAALNFGLKHAKNEVVTVFDAEDEPHADIYNIINTIMRKEDVDVVQSGVQLMNFKTRWFSGLNVMEYFMWFKSGLHFFANVGKITPLGGNTVFFKKSWLTHINGWDTHCLTEDADIAIRLTKAGAKIRIVYDEQHVTQEETPSTVTSFINQRTRWNQGFLQILLKGDWLTLPLLRQKIVMLYILTSPLLQALMFLYTPFGILFAVSQKLPLLITLISFIPFYIFLLQEITYFVSFYIFAKSYNLRFNLFTPVIGLLAFFPYQLMLVTASFRALTRIIFRKNAWQKTLHTNSHRVKPPPSLLLQYAK